VLQPPFDPTSQVVFDTAKAWIRTCRRSHKRCQIGDETGLSPLPTRVIDVGTSDAPTVRLHVTGSGELAERGEYACLSYCWGGDQFKTLLGNLEALKKEIPIARLSLTVADAVEVIRRLGLRYLWVDALCIVQDSSEDKAREIVKMGAIYKNSTVTIAAATASAASQGFLRRPLPALRSAAVRVRLPNDEIGIVRLTLTDFYKTGRSRPLLDHPLDSRGWCLQEYLLSPRMLVFSKFSVERICQVDEVAAGDGPFGHGQIRGPKFRLPTAIFGGNTIRDQLIQVVSRDPKFLVPVERIRIWNKIVSDFSGRGLTDPRDRLPALAGIVGELQRVWKDEYIFGMWKGLLPWMLAWVSEEPPKGPQSQRLSLAPTWSWASINSPVCFHHSHTEPIFARNTLIDITWETGAENHMAASSPPFPRLAVNGTLVRSTDAPREPLTTWLDFDGPFDQEEWSYLVITRNANWYWSGDVPTSLVENKMTYLVLKSVEGMEGVYTRVGLAAHRHKRGILREHDCAWSKVSKTPRVKIYLV